MSSAIQTVQGRIAALRLRFSPRTAKRLKVLESKAKFTEEVDQHSEAADIAAEWGLHTKLTGLDDPTHRRRGTETKPREVGDKTGPLWYPCKITSEIRHLAECDCSRVTEGSLALAEKLYAKHRKFVLAKIQSHVRRRAEELPAAKKGKRYSKAIPGAEPVSKGIEKTSDLEQMIWRAVAADVHKFKTRPDLSQEGELAWLEQIVHSVVFNHCRAEHAYKRANIRTSFEAEGIDIVNQGGEGFSIVKLPVDPEEGPQRYETVL